MARELRRRKKRKGSVIRKVLLHLASFTRLFPTRVAQLRSQTKENIF